MSASTDLSDEVLGYVWRAFLDGAPQVAAASPWLRAPTNTHRQTHALYHTEPGCVQEARQCFLVLAAWLSFDMLGV